MNPLIIAAAVQAALAILKQIEVYSRGQMSDEEIQAFHKRVVDFMRVVQKDADTLRETPK